jgi:uncharacterized protein YjbI with pentapeptide repeats
MPWIPMRSRSAPRGGGAGAEKEKKSGWDIAAALGQLIGAFAVVVSVAGLAVSVWLFKQQQQSTAAQTLDQQRQDAINQYYDDMSTLVLQDGLGTSKQTAAVRAIAEARTDTTVRYLDGARKGTLIRFLREARLIMGPNPAVSLQLTDLEDLTVPQATVLSGVNLSDLDLLDADLDDARMLGVNLSESHLDGANLSYAWLNCLPAANGGASVCANLSYATLSGADLEDANLIRADLAHANLTGAELVGADLTDADLSDADLRGATYNVATLRTPEPGGTVTDRPTQWPADFNLRALRAAGAVCVDC